MASSLAVYGFGSHFRSTVANDIDLVFVHVDLSPASTAFAIRTKQKLLRRIPSCHIVLLSLEEESELNFLARSRGIPLLTLFPETLEHDLDLLIEKIELGENVKPSA